MTEENIFDRNMMFSNVENIENKIVRISIIDGEITKTAEFKLIDYLNIDSRINLADHVLSILNQE